MASYPLFSYYRRCLGFGFRLDDIGSLDRISRSPPYKGLRQRLQRGRGHLDHCLYPMSQLFGITFHALPRQLVLGVLCNHATRLTIDIRSTLAFTPSSSTSSVKSSSSSSGPSFMVVLRLETVPKCASKNMRILSNSPVRSRVGFFFLLRVVLPSSDGCECECEWPHECTWGLDVTEIQLGRRTLQHLTYI